VLLLEPGFQFINRIIFLTIMLPASMVLVVPKFLMRRFGLGPKPKRSIAVTLVGVIIVLLLFPVGGSFLFILTYPLEAWFLSQIPFIYGTDLGIWLMGMNILYSCLAGFLLWKNFDVKL